MKHKASRSFLESVLAASAAPPARRFGSEARVENKGPLERDQHAAIIHAYRTERAIRVALDGLGEIVKAVPVRDLRTDVRLLPKLLNLAAKMEILLAKIGHFCLEVGDVQQQVGDGTLKLRIVELLRDLSDLFDASDDGVHFVKNAHCLSSCAIELLRWMDQAKRPYPAELEDIAIAMLEQDIGIRTESDPALVTGSDGGAA